MDQVSRRFLTSTIYIHIQALQRFVCLSDTHDRTFEVPPGDVLIHAGDLTETGGIAALQKTMHWIYDMPHRFKLIIAGNHDVCTQNSKRIHE